MERESGVDVKDFLKDVMIFSYVDKDHYSVESVSTILLYNLPYYYLSFIFFQDC